MRFRKWRVIAAVTVFSLACGKGNPAHAFSFDDIVDTVSDAVDSVSNVFDSVTGIADVVSGAMDAVGGFAGATTSSVSSGATSKVIFLGVGGDNNLGSYKQDTEVTITGKAESKDGSVVTVGQTFLMGTTITDKADITQRVHLNNVSASTVSEIHIGSVIAYKSSMQSLVVDTDVTADTVTATNGSRIEIGTLRLTNTTVGGTVDFKSVVKMGSAEATNGSVLLIGGGSL